MCILGFAGRKQRPSLRIASYGLFHVQIKWVLLEILEGLAAFFVFEWEFGGVGFNKIRDGDGRVLKQKVVLSYTLIPMPYTKSKRISSLRQFFLG